MSDSLRNCCMTRMLAREAALVSESGAKIINVFRAWIGAQLTICAQK